jgi:predicted Zn-dependent protease
MGDGLSSAVHNTNNINHGVQGVFGENAGLTKVGTSRYTTFSAVLLPFVFSASLLSMPQARASSTSEMYRTKAVFPIAEQDYAQAMALLDKAVAADDQDAQAWYYRGLVNSRTGEYDTAVRDMEAASALGFRHPDLFYELGYAYFHLQQYREASGAFEQSLVARPAHQRSSYYLGLSRFRLGLYEQALPQLQQVAETEGDISMAAQYLQAEANYHLGRKTEAREQLQQLLTREGSSRFFSYQLFPFSSLWSGTEAELVRSRASFDLAVKDFTPALSLLQRSVELDPQDTHSRYYRGVLLARTGDYGRAVTDLEQAAQADFPHPELQQELGMAYYGKGEYDKAIAPLQRALEAGTNPAASGYYLAASYYQLKQYPEALEVLEKTPRGDSRLDEASDYLKAETLYRMKRSEEARRLLKGMLAGQPSPEYKAKASALLTKVEQQARREKAFQLELSAGFLRDSNVGLYADDVALPSTLDDRADNRWQLTLDGKWKPAFIEGTPLTLGYRFFQSLHQQLDQFNLQHHDLSADWRQEQETFAWGINYQYILASLDNTDYVTTHQLMPNVMFYHGQKRVSVIKFAWRNDRYDYPGLAGYDGNRYQVDYRHYWAPASSRYHYLGALFRREDADDASQAFNAAGLEAGLLTSWQRIRLTADLQYQRKHYPDAPQSRDDDYYKVDLTMTYPLTSQINMDVSASRIENRTDATAYDYSRTLYGMTLRWQL